MKNVFIILVTTMMFMTSCSDNKVEKFVEHFTAAINNNDRGTIERLYPDAKKASALTLNFNRDSLRIESGGQQDEYMVTFAPNVWMRVAVDKNDSLVVKESKGLFSYDQSKLKFAKETGWYDEKLNDAENAERLSDEGFTDYLLKEFNTSVKNGLKIVNVGTDGDLYIDGGWVSCTSMTFVVKNSSPYNVPGSAYNILFKEGFWHGQYWESEIVPGKDIATGQQVTLGTERLAKSSQESETSHTLRVSDLSMDDFMSQFHPTGKEYEEYLKSGKVSPK